MYKRFMSALLLILGVVLSLPLLYCKTVQAESNPSIVFSDSSRTNNSTAWTKIQSAVTEANTNLAEDKVVDFDSIGASNGLLYTDNTSTVYFDSTAYQKLTTKSKQKVMQSLLNDISNSSMSTTDKNKLYNFISKNDESTANLVRQLNEDVNADFYKAYSIFKPFSGVLGTILGLLSLGIVSLLALTLLFDLSYITIPTIQDFLTERGENRKDKKPPLISVEAWQSVRESENSVGKGSYTSPINVWMRYKTKQMIVLSICLLYLVSGKIFYLIGGMIDMFQGFLPK